jgi:hypothetical protein
MAYHCEMEFIEAPAFTRHVSEYLDDDGYRKLQSELARNPEFGDLIPGTGGFRKLRWADTNRGKGRREVCESSTTISYPLSKYG